MPLVCDVAYGSWVDGPGLRTVIFLKGCPLRCAWCHNPELQTLTADDGVGREITPERLASIAARDKVFFETTAGGVTFSGGEPLLFIDYIAETAERLHAEGIHVAVETCGLFDLARYERRLRSLIDLLLFDLKIVDAAEHRVWTGSDNAPILRNLQALAASDANLVVRMPLVPGVTATEENLRAAAELLERLSIESFELLPYNPPGDTAPMPLEEELRWRRFVDAVRHVPRTATMA